MKASIRTSRVGNLNNSSGFTLIELSIVIVLFSIGLGLVFPLMDSGLVKNDFKNNMRHLQGLINEIRNKSILDNRRMRLIIELSTAGETKTAYWLETDSQEIQKPAEEDIKYLFSGNIQLLAVQKQAGPLKTSGRAIINFSPQGLVEPTDLYIISNGDKYRVFICPFSTRLKINKATTLNL